MEKFKVYFLYAAKDIKNSVATQENLSANNIQEMINERITEFIEPRDKNTDPPSHANVTPSHVALLTIVIYHTGVAQFLVIPCV